MINTATPSVEGRSSPAECAIRLARGAGMPCAEESVENTEVGRKEGVKAADAKPAPALQRALQGPGPEGGAEMAVSPRNPGWLPRRDVFSPLNITGKKDKVELQNNHFNLSDYRNSLILQVGSNQHNPIDHLAGCLIIVRVTAPPQPLE